ncbi:hypothetical protein CB1_000716001 [Camelus ferus]|nr:hypothetical protein CB1_000716001 [Camelus ferus]
MSVDSTANWLLESHSESSVFLLEEMRKAYDKDSCLLFLVLIHHGGYLVSFEGLGCLHPDPLLGITEVSAPQLHLLPGDAMEI